MEYKNLNCSLTQLWHTYMLMNIQISLKIQNTELQIILRENKKYLVRLSFLFFKTIQNT